ncbi:MAG: WYL domain-containing protein [Opitutaceae bacterium]|nr:WYL domain-containing protein [Opitutaceae bacterium]
MHRRSFLNFIGLVPLATATCVVANLKATETKPLPIEPWRDGPDTLERWRRAPRQPVWESDQPELSLLIEALRKNQRVQFSYFGGSALGDPRVVTPGHLYTVAGFPGHYLSGYCHLRDAERTFLVARMSEVDTL